MKRRNEARRKAKAKQGVFILTTNCAISSYANLLCSHCTGALKKVTEGCPPSLVDPAVTAFNKRSVLIIHHEQYYDSIKKAIRLLALTTVGVRLREGCYPSWCSVAAWIHNHVFDINLRLPRYYYIFLSWIPTFQYELWSCSAALPWSVPTCYPQSFFCFSCWIFHSHIFKIRCVQLPNEAIEGIFHRSCCSTLALSQVSGSPWKCLSVCWQYPPGVLTPVHRLRISIVILIIIRKKIPGTSEMIQLVQGTSH